MRTGLEDEMTPSARPISSSSRRSRPQLFVCGDLCNLGDLALLTQNIELRHNPEQRFFVRMWASLPNEIENIITSAGGSFVQGRNLFGSLIKAARCDIVIGGGQLVRDNSSLIGVFFLLLCCITCRLTGGKITTRGLGVSKLSRPRSYLYRIILSLTERINVRDRSSFENIKAILPDADISLTADMLFHPTNLSRKIQINKESSSQSILVSPCIDASEGRTIAGPNFVQLVAAAQRALPGAKLILVCHDIRAGMDGDSARRLIEQFDLAADIHDAPSLDELIQLYKSASLVVTNRLHSLIIALLTGAPVLVVDDGAKKIDYIAAEFDVGKVDVSLDDRAHYSEYIARAVDFDKASRKSAIETMAQRALANIT